MINLLELFAFIGYTYFPMKKIARSFLVLLILLSLIAACAPATPRPSATNPPVTFSPSTVPSRAVPTATSLPEITTNPSSLQGLQIQFMHPWSGDTASEIAGMVDEFNQSNSWGIHVITQQPGSAGQVSAELASSLATGNQPAMVAATMDALLSENAASDAFVDLNPYLYSNKWGLSAADLADFDALFLQQDALNGMQFGFPAQRTAVMMFYNRTWAQQLGFSSPPGTFEEFRTQSCAANSAMKKDTDTTNDGLGGWIVSTEGLVTYSWWVNFNVQLVSSNIYAFDTPAAQKAFENEHTLLTAGCAWIPRAQTSYDYFANRQALFYSGYLQDIVPQLQAFESQGKTDTWTLIPFPADQAQKVVVEGPSYAILKTTPEKQLAAWLFIRWLSATSQQQRLVQASLTLPLSQSVRTALLSSPALLQPWKDGVNSVPSLQPVPSDRNWELARTILEDATWQLFKTNLSNADIPMLLSQMDSTFTDLKDRKP